MNDQKLKTALRYHKINEIEIAIDWYNEIIKAEPDSAHVLHLLAIAHAQNKNFTEALIFIDKAITITPLDATVHNSRGNILKNQGEINAAQTAYLKALALAPNSATSHNNLGIIYMAQNQLTAAHACYTKAILLNPKLVDAHFNLALLLRKRQENSAAIQSFLNVLALEPKHISALNQLGEIYAAENDIDNAITQYHNIVDYNPEDLLALQNLGALFAKRGDNQQALTYLEAARKINPQHAETLSNLGAIYLTQNNLTAALECYLKLLALCPDFTVYYNIGVIYQTEAKSEEAVQFFLEALKIQPENFATLTNLAASYLKLERYDKTRAYYAKALKIEPQNTEIAYLLAALDAAEISLASIPTEIIAKSNNSPPPSCAPKEYLQHLFNAYAPYYDLHLQKLDYQAPTAIYEAVINKISNFNDKIVIDLGCGTGLCGEKFAPHAKILIGVDVADCMLEKARTKNIYTELYCQDMIELLNKYRQEIDLVISADTLVYQGDLKKIFATVQTALKPGGIFAFSIESTETYPFLLQKTARYAHHADYISTLAKKYQLRCQHIASIKLRKHKEHEITGIIYVFTTNVI